MQENSINKIDNIEVGDVYCIKNNCTRFDKNIVVHKFGYEYNIYDIIKYSDDNSISIFIYCEKDTTPNGYRGYAYDIKDKSSYNIYFNNFFEYFVDNKKMRKKKLERLKLNENERR